MKFFSKIFLFSFVLLICLSLGFVAAAQTLTPAQKQALIQDIQQKIAQLTAQLNQMLSQQGATNTASWCYTFNSNLGFPNSGTPDVGNLHIALQREGITYVPDEINQYSTPTALAIKQFQAKYGILQTGYVGNLTRAQLNQLYGCTTTTTTNTNANTNTNTNTNTQTTTLCTPNWQTTAWSDCTNNLQTRTVTDLNNCGTYANQPSTSQPCSSVAVNTTTSCVSNWNCSDYSSCKPSTSLTGSTSGTQTRTCVDTNNCQTPTLSTKPQETASCCSPSWKCSGYGNCVAGLEKQTCYDQNNCNDTSSEPLLSIPCCTSNWVCTDWGTCTSGTQTKTCYDSNGCQTPTTYNKPDLTQSCTTTCSPNWILGTWSTCQNSTQTRTVTDQNNCNITSDQPATSQPCCSPSWQTGDWGTCVNGSQTRVVNDANGCGVATNKPPVTQSCCAENWTCTDWGACTIAQAPSNLSPPPADIWNYAATQSRTCTDLNACGTIISKPAESQTCYYPPTVKLYAKITGRIVSEMSVQDYDTGSPSQQTFFCNGNGVGNYGQAGFPQYRTYEQWYHGTIDLHEKDYASAVCHADMSNMDATGHIHPYPDYFGILLSFISSNADNCWATASPTTGACRYDYNYGTTFDGTMAPALNLFDTYNSSTSGNLYKGCVLPNTTETFTVTCYNHASGLQATDSITVNYGL